MELLAVNATAVTLDIRGLSMPDWMTLRFIPAVRRKTRSQFERICLPGNVKKCRARESRLLSNNRVDKNK